MSDVILKAADGEDESYEGVDAVELNTADGTTKFVSEHLIREQEQADWSQTNTAKVSFIKNKPSLAAIATSGRYKDLVEKPFGDLADVVKEQTATFTYNDFFKDYSVQLPYAPLEEGKQYIVYWDGATYTCTARDVAEIPNVPEAFHGLLYLGNATLFWNAGYGEDTGEPFIFWSYAGEEASCEFSTADTAESHTVRVEPVDKLKKIDAKYLPDDYGSGDSGSTGTFEQVQADWDETDTTSPAYIKNKPVISGDGSASIQPNWEQNDDTQADFIKNKPFYEKAEYALFLEGDFVYTYNSDMAYWHNNILVGASENHLIAGEAYTVTFDGTVYICEAFNGGGPICVGNPFVAGAGADNGVPFAIAEDSTGAFFGGGYMLILPAYPDPATVTEVTYTVKIEGNVKSVQKIDGKFLPQSDWSENDKTSAAHVLNRPFYTRAAGATVLPETTVSVAEDGSFAVFDISFSLEERAFLVRWDGVDYTVQGVLVERLGYVAGNFSIIDSTDPDTGEPFAVCTVSGAAGVYAKTAGDHTIKIMHAEDMVQKIPAKYLPIVDSKAQEIVPLMSVTLAYYVSDTDQGWASDNPIPITEDAYTAAAAATEALVTWDGIEHRTTVTAFTGGSGVYMGNAESMGGLDTGEPFLVLFSRNGSEGSYTYNLEVISYDAVPEDTSDKIEHTLKVVLSPDACTIKQENIPDPPTFDLTAMGLPAFTMDGSSVSVECDTTELRAALDKGPVKILFQANTGEIVDFSGVLNAMKAVSAQEYNGCFIGVFSDIPMVLNIGVSATAITGSIIALATATA